MLKEIKKEKSAQVWGCDVSNYSWRYVLEFQAVMIAAGAGILRRNVLPQFWEKGMRIVRARRVWSTRGLEHLTRIYTGYTRNPLEIAGAYFSEYVHIVKAKKTNESDFNQS